MKEQFADLGVKVATDETDTLETINIMQCNWPAFLVFLACATQWRVVTNTAGLIFLGLDYPGCQIVLQHHAAAPHVFGELQAMEDAALEILNEAD